MWCGNGMPDKEESNFIFVIICRSSFSCLSSGTVGDKSPRNAEICCCGSRSWETSRLMHVEETVAAR